MTLKTAIIILWISLMVKQILTSLGILCTDTLNLTSMVMVDKIFDTLIIVQQNQATTQLTLKYFNLFTGVEFFSLSLNVLPNITFSYFDTVALKVQSVMRPTGQIDSFISYSDPNSGRYKQFIIGINGQQITKQESSFFFVTPYRIAYAQDYQNYYKLFAMYGARSYTVQRHNINTIGFINYINFQTDRTFYFFHSPSSKSVFISSLLSSGVYNNTVSLYVSDFSAVNTINFITNTMFTVHGPMGNTFIIQGDLSNWIACYDLISATLLWNITINETITFVEISQITIYITSINSLFQIDSNGQVIGYTFGINSHNGIYALQNGFNQKIFLTEPQFVTNDIYIVSKQCQQSARCDINQACMYAQQQIIAVQQLIQRQIDDFCFMYAQSGYCSQFSSPTCGTCENSPKICIKCRNQKFYTFRNGVCTAIDLSIVMTLVGASLNTIKINSIQPLFLFIDRLELYNYHQQDYNGVFNDALQFVDTVKQKMWNIFSQTKVQDWIEEPYALPSYAYFTDLKFQQIERKDCLFVQNTKDFFIIYMPVTFIVFVIFNRLFRVTSNHRISTFFRPYCFWWQLWLIQVVQNLSSLWFFCLKQLQVLFNLTSVMPLLRMLTVPLTGLIFIGSISLFFLCRYLYGVYAGYFFINTRSSMISACYMLTRYILKLFIDTAVHVLFTADTLHLLLALSLSSFLTLIIILLIEYRLNIHRMKTLFVSDCIVQATLLSLNLLLIIKHCDIGLPAKIPAEQIQSSIMLALSILASTGMANILVAIVTSIFQQIKAKLKVISSNSNSIDLHMTSSVNEIIEVKTKYPSKNCINHDLIIQSQLQNQQNQSVIRIQMLGKHLQHQVQ